MTTTPDFYALNRIATHVYDVAAKSGFHESDERPGRFAEFIANIHGEVSELWEAYRRGKLDENCDKPIKLTCLEEELADIIIRALDTARTHNVDIAHAVMTKSEYNETRSYKHGGKVA
jgi:NTP pyrophosphatase (non-canonical NTP hydrolase)